MMIDLIMDIFGPALLDQAKDAVAGPPGKGGLAGGGSPEARIKTLERDHERLKLVTMALWEILGERLGVGEAELRRRIEALDLLDERRDGRLKIRPPPGRCGACDRPLLASAMACPYCGAERPDPPLFP
jgi:predicted Zn-ribbon and HTH transcriptional regulator